MTFPLESRRIALTNLVRLAHRRPEQGQLLGQAFDGRLDELAKPAADVAVETGDPIGKVLAERLEREGSVELAERLVRAWEKEKRYDLAVTLREASIAAKEILLARYRSSEFPPDEEERSAITALAHNLGWDLGKAGRWSEGLTLLEEALAEYRAKDAPVEVASCLLNVSILRTWSGQREAALQDAEEAVALRRRLVDGTEGEVELANALSNLCACLSDLDRSPEALATSEEAVALFRRHRLDVYQKHEYANALAVLGNQLNDAERYEEALPVLEEAVGLRRELVAEQRTAFEADLALALDNLASVLANLHDHDGARQRVDEATDIYRALAAERSSFDAQLAWTLFRSGFEAGRHPTEEAVHRIGEATRLYRKLEVERPAVYGPLLARSLDTLSDHLQTLGRPREALEASDEAVRLLNGFVDEGRSDLERDLAWAWMRRSQASEDLGDFTTALEDARHAVELLRGRRPESSHGRWDRAAASDVLGARLHRAGCFEEAEETARESLALFRRLEAAHPGAFQEEVATTLGNLSGHLAAQGRLEEAVTSVKDAVEIFRELAEERPERFQAPLAGALGNLGLHLFRAGRSEEALSPARESSELYRSLERDDPALSPSLAESLHNLGTILDAAGGDPDEVLALFEEAVTHRRGLAEGFPGAFDVDLARSLVNLGKTLVARGRHSEAEPCGREAVRLLGRAVDDGYGYLAPQLAMARSNLAHLLLELGRPDEACVQAREAVSRLAGCDPEGPEPVREWALLALGHYLRAVEEMGEEPDVELVLPFMLSAESENDS